MSFHEKHENDLANLPDEELIAYLVEAREAGATDSARTAMGVFANRRFDVLVARAMLKLPNREDAEQVVMEVMLNAFQAAFKGVSAGEAMNLLYKALGYRVADFWRKREGKVETPLPEHLDQQDKKGPEVGAEQAGTGAVEVRSVVDEVLSHMAPRHRVVIQLRVFEDCPSKETAELVNAEFPDESKPMTDSNCDQIVRRFRKDLKDELFDS